MYSTCIFCHSSLGSNDVIEAFPVGRRLAFDASKGRLWVVCQRCERWNLTPIEERWEAVEECEQRFRDARLRVSTDNIGLARLSEGLTLVRIGSPQRPELAAWRYGDQFGRRRRKHFALVGAATVAGAVAVAGGVWAGMLTGGLGWQFWNAGSGLYKWADGRRVMARLPVAPGVRLAVTNRQLRLASIVRSADATNLVVRVRHTPLSGDLLAGVDLNTRLVPRRRQKNDEDESAWAGRISDREAGRVKHFSVKNWRNFQHFHDRHGTEPQTELQGDVARRALSLLVPRINRKGASREDVGRAVNYLVDAGGAESVIETIGGARKPGLVDTERLLGNLPGTHSLALEMALHEDMEREALEGELEMLQEQWRDAEEIAAIADNLLVPESVQDRIDRDHQSP